MKRTAIIGMILSILLCLLCPSAYAAEEAAAQIPIEIEGGGTAVVIPQVNSPVPVRSSLDIGNGMTEEAAITFTEPGNYSYTIKASDKDGTYCLPEYYTADVSVMVGDDGALYAVTVLSASGSDSKPAECIFKASVDPSGIIPSDQDDTKSSPPPDTKPTPGSTQSQPGSAPQPSQQPQPGQVTVSDDAGSSSDISRPKTGDDGMLDLYLLVCITASTGLFLLSVMYYRSVGRLIKGSSSRN